MSDAEQVHDRAKEYLHRLSKSVTFKGSIGDGTIYLKNKMPGTSWQGKRASRS
jgi:hypothetical protein